LIFRIRVCKAENYLKSEDEKLKLFYLYSKTKKMKIITENSKKEDQKGLSQLQK